MRPRMRTWLLLLVGTGCVTHQVKLTPTNSSPVTLRSRTPASVEVFTATPPPLPFVEVAVITSNYGDSATDSDKIRVSAANYGCDAVVFRQLGSTNAVNGTVQGKPGELGRPVNGATVTQSSAACVVYTGEASDSAPTDPSAQGSQGGEEGGFAGGAASGKQP
jgi:hypothetical protein